MTELSPQAEAVLEAAFTLADNLDRDVTEAEMIAAALRAVADQVVPKDVDPSGDWTDKDEVRYQILAIAAELETSTTENR